MAEPIYIVGNQSIIDIADAIREKNPAITGGITVANMPQAIRDIPTGGGGDYPYTKEELDVTENPSITHAMDYKNRYYLLYVGTIDHEFGYEETDRVLIRVMDGYYTSQYYRVSIAWQGDSYTVTLSPNEGAEFIRMSGFEIIMSDDLSETDDDFFSLIPLLRSPY